MPTRRCPGSATQRGPSPTRAPSRLSCLRCAPGQDRTGGAPSPYTRTRAGTIDAEDVAGAAEAMEALRARTAELEREARQRHEFAGATAERRAHDERLAALDQSTPRFPSPAPPP